VTLELALRKEFDYLVPTELEGQVNVGSRVQVPFGARKVLGCVTAVAEESARTMCDAYLYACVVDRRGVVGTRRIF